MKKNVLVFGFAVLATVNAAMIPPPFSEVDQHAIRDPTSEITENAPVGVRQSNTDVYIIEDNIQDTPPTAVPGSPAVRPKRQFGGFGLGGSGSQAATNSYGGGYGGIGYPGAPGGYPFGSPIGSTFGSPPGSVFGSPGGLGGGGGFGGLGGYGGLGGGLSGSTAQSSSSAFGAGGGYWG